ncbi:hypothetical protein [Alkalihalobacterium alkalinitrilicum]|uniref:hypothetical protein n=1 Tax=Alkalihalobacterium alkalinitrilicum TaxID=427920 RepID=UPI00099551C0|nr:hypothetical protein [Alkalihalobacterium alkalinitrilicum]
MESDIYIKDTPALIFFGLVFTLIFGLWLKRRTKSFDFNNRSKFYFLFDNYELVGGLLIGVGLLFIAIFL